MTWRMNGTAVIRRSPRPLRNTAGGVAVSVALAAIVLLAAGCGARPSAASGASSTSHRSASSPSAVSFSRCMRSNGVPNYPDPNGSGALPKDGPEQLGVSSARFGSATRACRHLLPNGGTPTQTQLQQVRAKSLAFSQCMRRHGVALPDPDSSGRIPDPASVGIDQASPHFEAANQACARVRPPYIPSNAAYRAYARSHGS